MLVYYAGHGDYEEEFEGTKEGGCWILHDGEGRSCTSKVLSAARLRRTLAKIKAKHLFLVADSCFSGAVSTRSGVDRSRGESDQQYHNDLRLPSSLVLTSGDPDRTVLDQDGSGHSPFAKALITTLRHPKSEAGFVSAGDLARSVRETYDATGLSGGRLKQLPNRPDKGVTSSSYRRRYSVSCAPRGPTVSMR